MKKLLILPVILNLFDGNTNTTAELTAEMKKYYSDFLIDIAEPLLIHDQVGQKVDIPKNGGKTIQFRKYDSLPKAMTALTEGVTPDGQKLSISTVESTVAQYGGYIELSDILLLTAVDNNLVQATRVLGGQAGRTLDAITREVINAGTSVQFADYQVSSREELVGGSSNASENHYLTVDAVRKAVRALKVMNAPKINGYYVGIIHPDCAYDIMNDPKWINVKSYSDPDGIYEGEIGRIEGVRFLETSEAKVFKKAAIDKSSGSEKANARDVYSTIIVGENAYGVTEIEGGGLQHIVKQLGSAGTADPLNQRATAGWKATKTAERLVEAYMVRIETTSTFNDVAAN